MRDPQSAYVFAFDLPHEVGEIVDSYVIARDTHCNALPHTPLFILGEATEEDWRGHVLKDGGKPLRDPCCIYFYFVSTD